MKYWLFSLSIFLVILVINAEQGKKVDTKRRKLDQQTGTPNIVGADESSLKPIGADKGSLPPTARKLKSKGRQLLSDGKVQENANVPEFIGEDPESLPPPIVGGDTGSLKPIGADKGSLPPTARKLKSKGRQLLADGKGQENANVPDFIGDKGSLPPTARKLNTKARQLLSDKNAKLPNILGGDKGRPPTARKLNTKGRQLISDGKVQEKKGATGRKFSGRQLKAKPNAPMKGRQLASDHDAPGHVHKATGRKQDSQDTAGRKRQKRFLGQKRNPNQYRRLLARRRRDAGDDTLLVSANPDEGDDILLVSANPDEGDNVLLTSDGQAVGSKTDTTQKAP